MEAMDVGGFDVSVDSGGGIDWRWRWWKVKWWWQYRCHRRWRVRVCGVLAALAALAAFVCDMVFWRSVRRSKVGKMLFGSFDYEYFVFADLGRGVLPPRRRSARP